MPGLLNGSLPEGYQHQTDEAQKADSGGRQGRSSHSILSGTTLLGVGHEGHQGAGQHRKERPQAKRKRRQETSQTVATRTPTPKAIVAGRLLVTLVIASIVYRLAM